MKKSLNITIFIISCIAISSFTTIVIFQFIPEVKNESSSSSYLDTFIFILTLIVAVLAFMFAFIGYNEFTRVIDYTKKVDDFEKQFHSKLKSTNTRQIQQERYIDHTAECLFQVVFSNISLMPDQIQAQQLLVQLFHELQIAKLYRVYLNANDNSDHDFNKITALEYLEANANANDLMADIPHLQHVAQNDPDEHIRRRAIEVMAIIRNATSRQQTSPIHPTHF